MVCIVVVVILTGGRAGDEAGKRRPTAGHVETCWRLAECVVPNHALERRRECPGSQPGLKAPAVLGVVDEPLTKPPHLARGFVWGARRGALDCLPSTDPTCSSYPSYRSLHGRRMDSVSASKSAERFQHLAQRNCQERLRRK